MDIYLLILLLISLSLFVILYIFFSRLLKHRSILKRLSDEADILPVQNPKVQNKQRIKKSYKTDSTFKLKLEKKLYDSGITLNTNNFIKLILFIVIFIFVLLFIITRSLLYSIAVAPLTPVIVNTILNNRRKKRLNTMSSQLSGIITSLSGSLKAGHSLMQALSLITKESSPPISIELEQLLQDINLGKTMEESIVKFADRNPIEELQILSMAILVNKETGGNLSYILDTTANTIRERERIKGQLKSLTAQGRLSGIILFLMPLFIMVVIYLLNPAYMRPLFTTAIGQLLLLLWLSGQIIGGLLIRKIIRIDW